jgi:hypothetical protein
MPLRMASGGSMSMIIHRVRRGASRLGWLAAAAALVTGCDSLLDVEAPSRVIASTLDDPKNASLLVTGAIADLECALGRYIVNAGLLGDEIQDGQLSGLAWDVDRRTLNENGLYGLNSCDDAVVWGVYRPLQVARFQADDIVKKLEAWTDEQVSNRTALIATASAHGGYAVQLLAEGFCSAAIDVGPELTPAQLAAEAEARFTKAITAAQAANLPNIVNMALVGRARSRLYQGKNAEALADAQGVTAGFVANATYSIANARRNNPVNTFINRNAALSIEADFRNLTFNGVADPRVSVVFANRNAVDQFTPLWIQNKYAAQTSSIPIARYEEAQLIIAEVSGGQTAVDIINALHTRANIPPFASNDPAEIQAQVIQERQRELFLEGHHLGDVRRHDLPLTPAAGTLYPPKAGGSYGDSRCFPLPASERLNNPNIDG